jgi:EAL domain-containing protein (putative c-di-GMP-specific phosphodiesterase class I)
MGKSLQPQKAVSVRQPANIPAAGPAAPNEPVTVESLGWQLRAALPPLRLHSVSIYDEQANVLWLSEGALGPDEHTVVVEAGEALGSDSGMSYYETGLEDGRLSIFLPVRSPQGDLVGLAMVLADIKSVADGVAERMITPQVRTIMQKVAVLLRPAQMRASQTDSSKILELAPEADAGLLQTSPPKPVASVSNISPATPAPPGVPAPVLSPQAVDDILEFELTPDGPPVAPPLSPTQREPAWTAVNGTDPATKSAEPVLSVAPADSATPPLAAAAPMAATPVPSLAQSFDLNLPVLDPPAQPVAFAGNVAQLPAVAPTNATASPSASMTANGSALAPPISSGSTTTSRTLTGTSKTLGVDTPKGTGATTTSRALALPDGVSLTLEVLPFSKLRAGGRTRRYEVLAKSSHPNRVPAGFDKIALQQLLSWMGANRGAWNLEPTSFTLNLSISTLEDERFPQFVASQLKANGIAPDNIGFEIAEALCLQRRAQVERFITLCDKLGCFVVIDDFSLDSSITGLLRSKALRLVKIDPKLTSVALKDKLAQAMVVAIAQAVKVLGIHCAAKRVDSRASLQWLTAIGCDFAQGATLAQMQSLESMGAQPAQPSA